MTSMFNFIERIKDFHLRKEHTDILIRAWKVENKAVYADFVRRIEAVKMGDMGVVAEMMDVVRSCIPEEVHVFHHWLGDVLNGKVKMADIAQSIQDLPCEYINMIAKCLVYKELWMAIDIKTGEVKVTSKKVSGCLMVRSGTPIEIWNRLPVEKRTYIISQTETLMKNGKGGWMFSSLERKMMYQAIAFFARLIFLTYASATGNFLANLYDLVIERKDNLPYCMYYYVVFDHGLTKMATVLNHLLMSEGVDQGCMLMVKDCINTMVQHSFDMGTETKASWEKTADECGADIWKEVAFLLRNMKGRQGNRRQVMSIDDLIVGNKAEVKKGITEFLSTNTEDISLAYLLVVLIRTKHVKSSVKYMTFHRAIEQFAKRHYGNDVPQKRYGEIKEFNFRSPMQSTSYKRAKTIIDRWTIYFEDCK